MDKLLLAWCAGFIDGDGYISIKFSEGKYYSPVFTLTNTHFNSMKRIQQFFNCGKITGSMRSIRNKDIFEYRLYSNNVIKYLELMLPYLYTKKEQAELILEFWRNKKNPDLDKRAILNEIIYEEIRELTKTGKETFTSKQIDRSPIKITDEILAWAAGIIDSEGCFLIKPEDRNKETFSIRFICSMSDQNTIQRFRDIFRLGTVYKKISSNIHHKDSFTYEIQGDKVKELIQMVQPYVYTKKEQVKLLSEYFRDCVRDTPKGSHESLSISLVAKRQIIYEEMKILNKRGR